MSVIRQKGESQNKEEDRKVLQEDKAHQIFRKTNILYPLIPTRAYAYQGVRNICFSFFVFFFSYKTLFEIPPFPLLATVNHKVLEK